MDHYKESEKLLIFKDNQHVGYLLRKNKSCEIQFTESFLKNERQEKLSFCIPKREKGIVFTGENLPTYFAGLLPEGLRLKALFKELKTSEDDYFTLLAAIGESCIGDIHVRLDTATPTMDLNMPKPDEIDFYEFFLANLGVSAINKKGDSISGVQEKISASMLSLPTKINKSQKKFLLKLNPKDRTNLVSNEFNCLKLAKKCGLDVNTATIIYDKNQNKGLLVERFDFDSETQKQIHQEDACQFLDRYPMDKYRIKFNDICERVAELATAPKIELLKLIELYVFSYFIGNGDLHAKNISLQSDHNMEKVYLSPCYDLLSTYIYKDHKMALKLDGRDDNFKMKYLVDFASRFDITKTVIEKRLYKLANKVLENREVLVETEEFSDKQKIQLDKIIQNRIDSF